MRLKRPKTMIRAMKELIEDYKNVRYSSMNCPLCQASMIRDRMGIGYIDCEICPWMVMTKYRCYDNDSSVNPWGTVCNNNPSMRERRIHTLKKWISFYDGGVK